MDNSEVCEKIYYKQYYTKNGEIKKSPFKIRYNRKIKDDTKPQRPKLTQEEKQLINIKKNIREKIRYCDNIELLENILNNFN
jgi:hypothetical protein